MTSYILVSVLILAISIPTLSSYLRNSDIDSRSENCGKHNGSCIDCISASRLNISQLCYFCGNSCVAADYTFINSIQDCYLSEFYVGQCRLNLFSILVLAVLACLFCCGSCILFVIIICCCCCCCQTRRAKRESHSTPVYTRLINRDSYERQKMREERTQEIRDRYLSN